MGMEQTENQDVFDIAERDVFRFSSELPDDASHGIPDHYHICVKTEEGYMIFSCCTSQKGKVEDRIKYFGRTYVELTNMKKSKLKEPTFVDCDNVYVISEETFVKYQEDKLVEFAGLISKYDYQNIVKGLLSSDLIELRIKKLLVK